MDGKRHNDEFMARREIALQDSARRKRLGISLFDSMLQEARMDGQRRNDVQTFVHWQERTPDYSRAPLPDDWWVSERQAWVRSMQRRSYVRAALKPCVLVALILFCWWRF